MPSYDLNSVVLFDAVVRNGGISPASRATGIAKSRLSRALRELERDLGARLVERSTRGFEVTELGRAYHAQCLRILSEVDAAQAIVESFTSEPKGVLRVATPPGPSAEAIAAMLPEFLAEFPRMQVRLMVGMRRVDIIREQIDVAVRVRSTLDTDADLVVKRLGELYEVVVASPSAVALHGHPLHPDELSVWPFIGNDIVGSVAWHLVGPEGARATIAQEATVASDDPNVTVQLARDALGAALLPISLARGPIEDGRLVRLLPQWQTPSNLLHLVFPSRRGMLPSARIFVDRVSEALKARLLGREGAG